MTGRSEENKKTSGFRGKKHITEVFRWSPTCGDSGDTLDAEPIKLIADNTAL